MNPEDPQFTHTLPSGDVVAADGNGPAGAADDGPPKPLQPGDSIGRYRIRARIGEGGMGVVYAAEDPELGRVVAIKVLRAAHGTDAELHQRRMLREAQALARVSHRNLVMVFDVGSLRGRVWIAMEYVAGVTLEAWLSKEDRRWSEIVGVFTEAARGLAAVHAVGLVHRDFKPGNVIVRDDGTVQVLDFGLAAQIGDADAARPHDAGRATPDLDALAASLTTTGAFMGTPAYMAPEQFMMLPTDGRTDQFSLCVALYEALYGHRPFGGRDLAQLMAATLEGFPGIPGELPGLPLSVRQVIARGLAKAPADRFPDMTALIAALEATRTSAGVRTSGGWRRFALGMIAGGAALATGLGVWFATHEEPVATPAPEPAIAPPVLIAPVAPDVPADAAVVSPAPLPVPDDAQGATSGGQPIVAATDAATPSKDPGAADEGLPQPDADDSPSVLPGLADLVEEPSATDGPAPGVTGGPVEAPAVDGDGAAVAEPAEAPLD